MSLGKLPQFISNQTKPSALVKIGALLPVTISVRQSRAESMDRAEQEAPFIEGKLLIDTGAEGTNLCVKVIGKLKVNPTGVVHRKGVNDIQRVETFPVRITLSAQRNGRLETVSFTPMVCPIYGIEHSGIVGILGRDILRHTRLVYDGVKGSFSLEIDIESIHQM